VWISKKRWKSLEKRVADLEEQVQNQQDGKPIEELKDSVADRLRKTEELHQNIKWKLPDPPSFLKRGERQEGE
jgi:uncharacterized coiled-coil protein SlyX